MGVLLHRESNWDFCGQILPCEPPGYRFVVTTAILLYCLRHISLMKCRPFYVSIPPKLHYFSQYSSSMLPQFLPEAMNFIHNKP